MKTLIVIIGLCWISQIQAQDMLDTYGLPNENGLSITNTPKFSGETFPVTYINPQQSFPSPTALPTGIAYDGEYLWVCGYNEYQIFCVSPFDGSVLKTLPLNVKRPYGIACQDSLIYILDNENKQIVSMNTNGVYMDTLVLNNYGDVNYPTGLCVDGQSAWFNDTQGASVGFANDSTLNICMQSCNILNGLPSFGEFPSGIAKDGESLWVTDNFSQTTFRVSLNDYSIQDRITSPGGAYPNGLAWDGNGLWFVNNSSDSIYFIPYASTQNIEINAPSSQSISCWPNPVKDQLHIKSTKSFQSINVFDISGKLVAHENLQFNDSNQSFKLPENLINGLYFIETDKNERIKIVLDK